MSYKELPLMDHDRFFKVVFSDPQQAASLLRFALPPETIANLDLQRLSPMPTNFVTSLGGEGRGDLFFHCPVIGLTGEELLIAVLFEHKSYSDPEAITQMARYWANLVIKGQAMPVLSVLFYHNNEQWTPPDFKSMFATLPESLRKFQPDFPVVFVDLARKEDSSIREHQGLDGTSKVGLIFLKHIFDSVPDIEMIANQILIDLGTVEESKRSDLLKSVFVYLMKRGIFESAPLEKIMDILPESQRMPFKTWEEGLIEKYEALGMARGEAKGQAIGEARGAERNQVFIIQNLLSEGLDWPLITRATGVAEADWPALQAKIS